MWDVADELRANSKLKSSEYSTPVLGLIFLRYADSKFAVAEKKFAAGTAAATSRRRTIGKTDYQALGVMYLPEKARYGYLLSRPEGADIGRAINEAMKAIEEENEDLKGVLPKTYTAFENSLLVTLLKTFASIPMDIEGDVFGRVYEYFIGEFARAEGQKGGEDYTPTAVVKLIVEIIEPYHGRIFDPASGAGGMFVQSAKFVRIHAGQTPSPSPLPVGEGGAERRVRVNAEPITEISVYGQERVTETVRLAKMNLAVHGLAGEIREGNTYYEDIHNSVGRFDFTMSNPPFNVDRIDKDRLAKDPRFPFGLPRTDNGNYIWIQMFYSSLNPTGRAGFVMANSASDARGSELEIRKKLIETGAVDVMVAVGSNMFYNVTLPATLWFFDRAKAGIRSQKSGVRSQDTVLFLDARHIYRQIDRAHRDFTPEQIEYLANIVRLYRGEAAEFTNGGEKLLKEKFPGCKYRDVAGLCKVATLKEIEAQGWSLNPGRYVGVGERPPDDFDFAEKLEELNEELETLNAEARELEDRIAENVTKLLES
ncbi:MAG: SAM-dependent DNA methyltransferase [Verrucomicrobia bacterium]|nr:SAM-dependent DNA methyltransferase [Verrucomicrobiota bacterium]